MSTIEIQFDKKIDNSRVIREIDLRCRADYICITLLGAVFVFGALFYAWQQYQWIQHGYRIEEAQRRIDELSELGLQLRIERASLATPLRIGQIARDRLGMVAGDPGQYVVLEPGEPGTTTPAAPTLFALGEESRRVGP
jgi:cell division protein FtsL